MSIDFNFPDLIFSWVSPYQMTVQICMERTPYFCSTGWFHLALTIVHPWTLVLLIIGHQGVLARLSCFHSRIKSTA